MPIPRPEAVAKPEVLIVGAGIGGLILGILLEQINIPYHIFERASEVKPLGSAMAFGGDIFPALEQLGIYEELYKAAKEYDTVTFYDGKLKKLGAIDLSYVPTAPDFYAILLKRVPPQKLSFKKKVLRTEEKEGRVIIHCSDNTSYVGDIVVGADGAHSGVRQSLYKNLDKLNQLPKTDNEAFSIGYTVIVGVAKPTNLEKYPVLSEDKCSFNQIVYKGNSNCYIVTLPNNQISWGFGTQLPRSMLKEMHFRNSEWSAEASETTLNAYRDHPNPIGGTMGDMFDATPKDLISKVYLEEKLFHTWYHGRTVLIGDACHKLHPAGGRGAKIAIEDAIVFANCLYAMKDKSMASITGAFEEYYKQRFPYAEEAYTFSSLNSKILNGQKWFERMMRQISLSPISGWLLKMSVNQINRYRQQVAWLPLIENRGSAPVLPQKFNTA
ncbi:hypothetical protein BGZ76_003619, partial [Entomortierella beljakovae]